MGLYLFIITLIIIIITYLGIPKNLLLKKIYLKNLSLKKSDIYKKFNLYKILYIKILF